ncbi:lycopene cyclase family protein [Nocardia sp. CDC153]|uniref:lycopene cyclase family protein n=1 Tax=Nocardia sp. CDC153 TaxID=3112167 RepID=UPI002DB56939|nr:lycopene cyclase family protein [Nocardia sp. CDC153]MEC3953198.1 lycopene cyclase family protein [Nocardia sp. CDC153]
MTDDLLICGAGPAGRALAHRALAHGLTVTLVDPNPHRRWTPTYAAWSDELPDWLQPNTIAATIDRPVAWTTRRIELDRPYTIFDTAALQDSLDLTGARLLQDRVVEISRPTRHRTTGLDLPAIRLASGPILPAGRVIDARGVPRSPALAEQTAFGVIVDRPKWPDTDTYFMDWRDDNGADPYEPRSFLYAVPLNDTQVLLEETCLAGRPALDLTTLRDRLHTRLRSRGITLTGTEPTERVHFPVHGGKPTASAFGAAGALMHPATGYSVATSLRLADTAISGDSTWPVSARAVMLLRQAGLRALLALPPTEIPGFFDAFFAMPTSSQRAYLSGRDDLRGTATAMATLFAALPWRVRRELAAALISRGVGPRR